MAKVFSTILVIGVVAFLTWQVVGIVKDIKQRVKNKKSKSVIEEKLSNESANAENKDNKK